MSIYFQGLNEDETYYFTEAIINSGDRINLEDIEGIKVDKHSTGGIGDKITLVLGPILSSVGFVFPKISGRGLGFTGGTVDKLESIPGFKTDLEIDEFINIVSKNKIGVMGQSKNITPADKKIYGLRDVTGTVDNRSLIASSVMSKKIACGADIILLDVKVGKGAFTKTYEDGEKLAKAMISIGKKSDKKVICALSNMNKPLGYSVGNALEIIETTEVLKGNIRNDVYELSSELAIEVLLYTKKANTRLEAKDIIEDAFKKGLPLSKFKEFIASQGGDSSFIDDYTKLGTAKYEEVILAEDSGFIEMINGLEIGKTSLILGAGRLKKEDAIDFNAGIYFEKVQGDRVKKGDIIARLYSNDLDKLESGKNLFKNSFKIGNSEVKEDLIKDIIG